MGLAAWPRREARCAQATVVPPRDGPALHPSRSEERVARHCHRLATGRGAARGDTSVIRGGPRDDRNWQCRSRMLRPSAPHLHTGAAPTIHTEAHRGPTADWSAR